MGMVFLSRSWENDKSSILKTFEHLRESKVLIWLFGCCWLPLTVWSASLLANDSSRRNACHSSKDCRVASVCKVQGHLCVFFLLVSFSRRKKKGLPHLQHVLLPRTKGLLATFAGLHGSLETVIDVTLAWSAPPGWRKEQLFVFADNCQKQKRSSSILLLWARRISHGARSCSRVSRVRNSRNRRRRRCSFGVALCALARKG